MSAVDLGKDSEFFHYQRNDLLMSNLNIRQYIDTLIHFVKRGGMCIGIPGIQYGVTKCNITQRSC